MTMTKPGDDLTALSNAELVAVIREYGLNAPWYGDEDERTPQDELHERRPDVKALSDALAASWISDQKAAGGIIALDAPESPATQRIRDIHAKALDAALKGMVPEPTLESASANYRRTLRAHNRAKAASKLVVQREKAEGATETALAAAMGVDRMTIRSWLGKR